MLRSGRLDSRERLRANAIPDFSKLRKRLTMVLRQTSNNQHELGVMERKVRDRVQKFQVGSRFACMRNIIMGCDIQSLLDESLSLGEETFRDYYP